MHNNNNNNIHYQSQIHSSSTNLPNTLIGNKNDRSINAKRTLSSSISNTDDPTASATGPKRLKNHQLQQRPVSSPDPKQTMLLHTAPQTAPQLLQQLMAPTPQQQQNQRDRDRKIERGTSLDESVKHDTSKWGTANNTTGMSTISRQNSVPPSASNSVLKNLLVSGCDLSAGYVCIVPMRAKKALKT